MNFELRNKKRNNKKNRSLHYLTCHCNSLPLQPLSFKTSNSITTTVLQLPLAVIQITATSFEFTTNHLILSHCLGVWYEFVAAVVAAWLYGWMYDE